MAGAALAMLHAPSGAQEQKLADTGAAVTYIQVKHILSNRCQVCHSATPQQQDVFEAPKGIRFDTPFEIATYAPKIKEQAVVSENMPPGNVTEITPSERKELGDWIAAGAKVP
jgi:uncharacterized membrane protein